jgi:hypothetical protein
MKTITVKSAKGIVFGTRFFPYLPFFFLGELCALCGEPLEPLLTGKMLVSSCDQFRAGNALIGGEI